ncbi:MAG: transcription termination/antitermination protein NusA [Lachnospiraceae bacterium]|jgi:N utilization substance protein A|nr:transcription termination/antitermination protein NusA [Lachnospiraceae bacterium]
MNSELLQALDMLEKEKEISKDILFAAIEDSLKAACREHLGRNENVVAEVDRETGDFHCYYEKEVVETEDDVEDDSLQIAEEEARKIAAGVVAGDTIRLEVDSAEFGRIAAGKAKNVILQKIREEEKSSIYNLYRDKVGQVVTGIVQRQVGNIISINLGKADAQLAEKEIVPEENLRLTERVKVYILGVPETKKGFKILVSRTHANLVKRLFEEEVTEIRDGTVEIVSIAREPGSRTKMAVRSNEPDVDPVGACVGQGGARVDAVVAELRNEKIDIVEWDENPGNFIQNALSPAKIVAVFADPEEKTAKVVVPDYQLSLAIGKAGQNARLAAKLTGYKIDIKSETQAKDAPGFRYEDYLDDEYDDGEYDEDYEDDYESEEYAGEEYETDEYGEEYEMPAEEEVTEENFEETPVEDSPEEAYVE